MTEPESSCRPIRFFNFLVIDFENPLVGKVKIPGYPIHFSASGAGTRSLAPGLGEHTDQILRDMGYSDEEIGKLKEESVIK